MSEFTYFNHLKAHYVPSRDALIVEVGTPTGEIRSPLLEAIRAAELIARSASTVGQELWLCMSGGVDSESMARAFLAAKVYFRVAILRFEDGLNDFDICHAVQFCQDHGIKFQLFELDIVNFFDQGGYAEYAKKYACRSPQIVTHLYLLDQIPGFPVLAWNVTSLHKSIENDKLRVALPNNLYFSYHRYFEKRCRPGVGFFFLYTPELFYSFFRMPAMRNVFFQQENGENKTFDYATKCRIYQEGGFEILPRQDKFTGFEEVKKYYEALDGGAGAFDKRFRKPLEELYPDPLLHYAKISGRYLPTSESR